MDNENQVFAYSNFPLIVIFNYPVLNPEAQTDLKSNLLDDLNA